MVGRKGEYLFRKPGSDVWHIRLQYPTDMGRAAIRRSLRTTKRDEAELLALPLIQAHKTDLLTLRRSKQPAAAVSLRHVHEDGHTTLEDGTVRIVSGATIYLIRDGETKVIGNPFEVVETRDYDPNDPPPLPANVEIKFAPDFAPFAARAHPQLAPLIYGRKPREKKPLDGGSDAAMLEAFLGSKTRNSYYNKEARDTWANFKAFCGGRAMKDCTRKDGRAYAEHLRAKGAKNGTILKKINYLKAPLTYDPEFLATNINPFERAVVHVDDAEKRVPLTEDDMKLFRDHMLPKLRPDEKLLWLLCATMGMRHSEAYTIAGEDVEDGVRFVHIAGDDENGKRRGKTRQSKRRVPLPDCLLPFLPKTITGPLFTDSCKNVSKNLLRALRRAGITDTDKKVYSLRHRAHDRLRNMPGITPDIERRIVGHRGVRKDSHDNYGTGHAMRVLKPFVDQIGY